jgi:NADPH-dependent glutamate synthase beta subunit-like oxidoreductase
VVRVAGRHVAEERAILATGKHVVVIGGGDTGSDCVCTWIRQGAKSVTQLVVWAIREGRQAARSVDQFLLGYSELPR